jgi:hypothetical protein
MSSTSSLDRLRALSREERHALARALMLLPLAAASLRAIGVRRTQAVLLRMAQRGTARGMDPPGLARMVSIASRRGPFRVKCLPSALTLQALLLHYGFHAELHVGVRKRGAGLEAHAWVEHEAMALMESDVRSRFHAFHTPLAASPRRPA